jgi:hypothetical protein
MRISIRISQYSGSKCVFAKTVIVDLFDMYEICGPLRPPVHIGSVVDVVLSVNEPLIRAIAVYLDLSPHLKTHGRRLKEQKSDFADLLVVLPAMLKRKFQTPHKRKVNLVLVLG